MTRLSSILVAVDFSAPSLRALDYAVALAVRAKASLTIVHAWNPQPFLAGGDGAAELAALLGQQKAQLVDRLEACTTAAREQGADASSRLVEGAASRVVPDLARSLGKSLVVVGRRGAAGLSHVLLGSVSERVVHRCACPVLVAPEAPEAPVLPGRFVVGVDFSAASRRAHAMALDFGEALGTAGAPLLLHVRASRDLPLEDWSELVDRGNAVRDPLDLERWARETATPPPPVEARVVEGHPAATLLEESSRIPGAWLVVGLQGRTALATFLVGSTTDRILRHAQVPVLVVPGAADAGEVSS